MKTVLYMRHTDQLDKHDELYTSFVEWISSKQNRENHALMFFPGYTNNGHTITLPISY